MGEYRDRFMLHYNFPPYATGETGRVGSPKRREIGHGRLAKRALIAVLPTGEEFAYSMRVVSEITESNGSSSMASVCGASLALMDAGVPTKAHVAGIAMGLIKDGNKFAVLTDILGDEDHLGDMDFKVAGTDRGVTALQMDIKIQGITKDIMAVALSQAREGRMHILGLMQEALPHARTEISAHAPRMYTFKINPEKIRDVIGKGGAVIRALTEETGCTIDIKDDGTVTIASVNAEACEVARKRIEGITAEVEVGKIYEGPVLRLLDFGAIVQLLPGKDGLLHISQIAKERVNNVSDYVKEGQIVRVKVIEADEKGRVRLSMKAAAEEDAQTGRGSPQTPAPRQHPQSPRRPMRRRSGSPSKRNSHASVAMRNEMGAFGRPFHFVVSKSVGRAGQFARSANCLMSCVPSGSSGRWIRHDNVKKRKRFIMLLQTLAWRPKTGWSAPWPAGMDSPSTLAVIFGGRASRETEAAVGEVAARLPNSILAGCSTAGEIHGEQVQDASLSVAIASFAHVTLRKVVLPIRDPIEAFAVGPRPRTRARRTRSSRGVRAVRRPQREREPPDVGARRRAARRRRGHRRTRRRRRALRIDLGDRRARARRSLRHGSRLLRRSPARRPRLPGGMVELRSGAVDHARRRQRAVRARQQAGARAVQELSRRARERPARDGAALPARSLGSRATARAAHPHYPRRRRSDAIADVRRRRSRRDIARASCAPTSKA